MVENNQGNGFAFERSAERDLSFEERYVEAKVHGAERTGLNEDGSATTYTAYAVNIHPNYPDSFVHASRFVVEALAAGYKEATPRMTTPSDPNVRGGLQTVLFFLEKPASAQPQAAAPEPRHTTEPSHTQWPQPSRPPRRPIVEYDPKLRRPIVEHNPNLRRPLPASAQPAIRRPLPPRDDQ
jgi:hypothetical protein